MKIRQVHAVVVQPRRPHYIVFSWMDYYRNFVSMFAVGLN